MAPTEVHAQFRACRYCGTDHLVGKATFGIRKNGRGFVVFYCRKQAADRAGRYYAKHKSPEFHKQVYEKYGKGRKAYFMEWVSKNKDAQRAYNAEYRKNNREHLNDLRKRWVSKNREVLNAAARLRREENPNSKLRAYLRNRLTKALKQNQKTGSAIEALGCSADELRTYLEAKFTEGMSWKNWGVYGWHIDHVIPLSWFDLTDERQFNMACHYTNLQPLWAEQNLQKHNRYVHKENG